MIAKQQRYQPNRKVTGSEGDQPKDGKTTSTHVHKQMKVHGDNNDLTNDMARLTTALHGKRLFA